MRAHIIVTDPVLTRLNRHGKGDNTAFDVELGSAQSGLRVTLVINDPHEADMLVDALTEAAITIRDASRSFQY